MGRTIQGELSTVTILDQEEAVNLVSTEGEQIHVCALNVSEVGGRQEWIPPQTGTASALLTQDDVVSLVQHLLYWVMGSEAADHIVREFLAEVESPGADREAGH
jgi:hypothetical protein